MWWFAGEIVRVRAARGAGVAFALAFGCTEPGKGESGGDDSPADTDTGGDSGDDTDSGTSDSDSCGDDVDTAAHGVPVGLCADGGWGRAGTADGVVHVAVDGSDDATGHWWDPVATFPRALDLAACDGRATILLGPGRHEGGATLSGGVHDDLGVYGCGVDETTIAGATDTGTALLRLDLTTGVTLADFATEGGYRAIVATGGEATLDTLRVVGGARTGILGYGAPVLRLVDVDVQDTVPDADGNGGYGISVQGKAGGDSGLASLSMEGGGIRSATNVGLLAHAAVIALDGVIVDGTLPSVDDGGLSVYGRGVQVQAGSSATLSGCTLRSNTDAAVFATEAYTLVLEDTLVDQTYAASVGGADATPTGDAIVAVRGDGGLDAADYVLSVTGSTITTVARAAVLVEDTTVAALDATWDGSGYAVDGVGFLYQGAETDVSALEPGTMASAPSLPLNRLVLAVDDGG